MTKFNVKWPIQESNGTTLQIVAGDTVIITRAFKAPKTVGMFKTQTNGRIRLDKLSMNNPQHFFRKYQAYAEQCSLIDKLDDDVLIVCHVKGDGMYYQDVRTWKEKGIVDNFGAGDQYFLPKRFFKKAVIK